MWNPFKKNPAEEESLKLNQIQAQLEEANSLVFRHKEFFNITPAEAVYVLTNKFNCKVTFDDETLDNQEEMINDADE